MGIVGAIVDGKPLARHGGQPEDGAALRLAVDLVQHHIRGRIGEGALAMNGRQLAGIAQNEDRLSEGQEIVGHLLAHHGHLVEHDQVAIAHKGLAVEDKARLMDVREAQLQPGDLHPREGKLAGPHQEQSGLELRQFLLDTLDFFLGGLRDAVDQAVDGGGGRALPRHHESCLAGEGGKQHAAPAAALPCFEAKRVYGMTGDGTFSASGIAEQAEHLLDVPTVRDTSRGWRRWRVPGRRTARTHQQDAHQTQRARS